MPNLKKNNSARAPRSGAPARRQSREGSGRGPASSVREAPAPAPEAPSVQTAGPPPGGESKDGLLTIAELDTRTREDLLDLAPDRDESHFHVGAAVEMLGDAAEGLPASEGDAER